jgi:SAM-dependent methyltransferase
MLARFRARFYDHVMQSVEDRFLSDWRRLILEDAKGRVLEIGAGTGANLPYYGEAVEKVVACEPDRHMRRILEIKGGANCRRPLEIKPWPGEALDLPDASFDTVVSTLVLCSVRDQAKVLAEIRRVLKPGGRFLFLEHVCPCDQVHHRRILRLIEPLWKRLAGNCHLTRETGRAMDAAGFVREKQEVLRFPGVARWVGPVLCGCATHGD